MDVVGLLKRIKIPFAYDHFAEGEKIKCPFICYLYPKANNFSADGVAFLKKDVLHIELYTDKKDIKTEKILEDALDNEGIFYYKSETYIPSEKMYEVLYEMEVIHE